jgi:hypothetical protein
VWIVDETQLYKAKAIVARYLAKPPAAIPGPLWTCAKCGEQLEPQFSDCWKCGAPRPE